MEIRLNLATQPLENTRRFLFTAGAAGAVLLILLFFFSAQSYRTWKENGEMREEMARLQSDMRAFQEQRRELEELFKRDETKRVMDRAGFLNSLIEQRSFPWTRIFMDLEGLLPVGTRVISLAPKRDGGRVELHIVVVAQNDASKVKFLKALEDAPQFESVVLNTETRKESSGGEEDPLTLEVSARYRLQDAPAKPKVATLDQKGAS